MTNPTDKGSPTAEERRADSENPSSSEREADVAWLRQLKIDGHCGEGTLERIERERANERIDRIVSAISQRPAPEGGSPPEQFDAIAFGVRLRQARETRRLSLQDLADKANLSKAHVWELEQARSQNPGANALCDLSRALRVSSVWLFAGIGPSPAQDVDKEGGEW